MLIRDGMTPAELLKMWMDNNLLSARNTETFDEYYRSYKRSFGSYMMGQYNLRLQELLTLVDQYKSARPVGKITLLDVGCGCGMDVIYFSALEGITATGIDIKQDRLSAAAEAKSVAEKMLDKTIACELRHESLFDTVKRDYTYDIIWMEQTFHHLEPRDEAVEALSLLVKPGGHIVISESNALNPLVQSQLFLRRRFKVVTTYTDVHGREHVYGNERILTARKLAGLFEQNGVTEQSVRYFRILPNLDARDAFLVELDRVLSFFALPVMFVNYNFVGRKTGFSQEHL